MTRPTGEDEMSNETEAAAMTDPKLLPLPEGVDVIFSPDGNGAALDVFTVEQVQDYARAVAEHNVKERDAEIEALRAEVATWEGLHASEVQVRQRWQARAERLAEALRDALECGEDGDWQSARNYINEALRDHDQEGKDG